METDRLKVLGIFAHPDDEILWGWPIFQSHEYRKRLLLISDNRPERKKAFESALEVGTLYDWMPYCVSLLTNFYRLQTRRVDFQLCAAINRINGAIKHHIQEFKPDFVITHNPVGEYGHGDHRLLFNIICSHPDVKRVVFTDICLKNKCHFTHDEMPHYVKFAYYFKTVPFKGYVHYLNPKWFDACRKIYQKHKAWSWDNPYAKECKLYEINT